MAAGADQSGVLLGRKKRPGPRETLLAGAHLAALWALTFAQPLLDLLGANPEFFIARGNTALDILILAVGFTLGPPLIFLFALAIAAAIGRWLYMAVYLGLVAVLTTFLAVQILERLFGFDQLSSLITGLVSIALGCGFAWALTRGRFFRAVLDVLSVAPLLILILFIFFSGTSRLILPQDQQVELGSSVQGQVPVVVVIFDEFPAATLMNIHGQLDQRRFPGFARLAHASTWYPNATTVADFTARAVPAILTGKNPDGSELPIAADQPQNIFTLLGRSYAMNVREAITDLCPESLCDPELEAGPGRTTRLKALVQDLKFVEGRLVLPADLADLLPDVTTAFGDFGAMEGVASRNRAGAFLQGQFTPPSREELAGFVDQIPADGRTLSLIHMELPHEPFRFYPNGRSYNTTELSFLNTPSGQAWAAGPTGIATTEQRHFLQTGYADTLIRTMISRLERLGIWRQALVVVTADHGISFAPGVPRRMADEENLAAVANVPLFIKYPGQEIGRVDRRHVQTVDVLPTIARELDIDDLFATEGEPIPREPDRNPASVEGDVEVVNGRGERVSMPLAQMIEQREQILARTGLNLGTAGLDSLGPFPRLVGRTAPFFVAPLEDQPSATIANPEIFRDVDLAADPLPGFITGSLSGVDPGEGILIAVNGRVAATTRAFKYKGDIHFGAVVPLRSLRQGENEVTVYLLDASGEIIGLGSSRPG